MSKQKKKIEFSKLIMVGVMLTYFIAMFFVMGVIWKLIGTGNTSIGTIVTAFCSFVGAPVGVAIAFYSWKSKNENTAKIAASTNNNIVDYTIPASTPINTKEGI